MTGADVEQCAGPAPEKSVRAAEEALGHPLPGDLREFLLEIDGITDTYGTEFVWSTDGVLRENTAFRQDAQLRELYAPFDALVFFGENGGGDRFAFRRGPDPDDGQAPVLVWDHETDDRSVIAPSFARFLSDACASDGEDWYRADSA